MHTYTLHVGIGRHTAIALSAAGWHLALTARRLPELQETKAACADPERCLLVDGDITDEAFVKRLFEKTIDRFGRLDLLFNVRRHFSQKANVLLSFFP
jgi:NAD(P)-dependent dehydrogenase (short-subunit alcohol dehydrogenase family)